LKERERGEKEGETAEKYERDRLREGNARCKSQKMQKG
jgi:hypothetical protein